MSADLFEESLERLLNERCGPEVRKAAESEGWAGDLWDTLADVGFSSVSVPEAVGGSGGDFSDAVVLCRLAGRHAVPLPLAECTLVGGWLVEAAGLSLPTGPLSVAVPRSGDGLRLQRSGDGWTLNGQLGRVPFGAQVPNVIAIATTEEGPRAVLVEPRSAALIAGKNIAGEPRDAMNFDHVTLAADRVGAASPAISWELELRGALSRALLIGGAMEAVAEMTIAYADQRRQFGRPIASFQAVANRLVRLVSETEMAVLAAVTAAERFAEIGVAAAFEVAAAKSVASRAASEVAAHAHQVHAAIGMTQEYPLHHFTRRLWAWRQEWGSERRWAQYLGQQVAELPTEMLWPRVTGDA